MILILVVLATMRTLLMVSLWLWLYQLIAPPFPPNNEVQAFISGMLWAVAPMVVSLYLTRLALDDVARVVKDGY
jgi:hypothetical protein